MPNLGAAQGAEVTCGVTYTVAAGDSLGQIAIRAYGENIFEVIHDANRADIGDNPNRLFVGQQLIIPCQSPAQVAAAPAPEVVTPQAPPVRQVAVTPSEPVVLTFNKTSDPRFVINSDIVNPFLNDIEIATQGRVLFIDPPVMNRDARAQLGLVLSGEVDATYVLNSTIDDMHPLLGLPMMPLMGGSAQQTAISFWNLHDRYLSETNYFDEVHLLGFIASPAAHIWRRATDPVRAGEGIIDKNDYATPYFLGLDTLGPQIVRERTAEVYDAIDEDVTG